MSKNITCPSLQSDLAHLKSLQQEFDLALDKARETGDLTEAKRLKAEIEPKMSELKEKLWPFKELSKQELEKQYQSQKEIFQRTGILERLSGGELGLKGIDNKEYPFPEMKDIFKMMKENREILKTKSEQGFQKLLITPFGMKLDDLIERYKQALWKHYQEKKLFATKKNQDDPNEPLIPLELDKRQPLLVWDGYQDADINGNLIYYPETLPTTTEEPDAKKREKMSKGKTKKEILQQDQDKQAGWTIQLIEDLPNIPRKDQGKIIGNRPQLDTAGSSIKKYIKEGKDIPSPQEYLKALQNEPIYQHEQGMTPEEQLTYSILHLEETNQVIDDWQGNGSISYQTGVYLPASGSVSCASWFRDDSQAFLGGSASGRRVGVCGLRGSVRVKKA